VSEREREREEMKDLDREDMAWRERMRLWMREATEKNTYSDEDIVQRCVTIVDNLASDL
jgi:hypothetical protein